MALPCLFGTRLAPIWCSAEIWRSCAHCRARLAFSAILASAEILRPKILFLFLTACRTSELERRHEVSGEQIGHILHDARRQEHLYLPGGLKEAERRDITRLL